MDWHWERVQTGPQQRTIRTVTDRTVQFRDEFLSSTTAARSRWLSSDITRTFCLGTQLPRCRNSTTWSKRPNEAASRTDGRPRRARWKAVDKEHAQVITGRGLREYFRIAPGHGSDCDTQEPIPGGPPDGNGHTSKTARNGDGLHG